MLHERAGHIAQNSDLVDVPHLITSYYTGVPDPGDARSAGGLSARRDTGDPASIPPSTSCTSPLRPGPSSTTAKCTASRGRCSSGATPMPSQSPPGSPLSKCWQPRRDRDDRRAGSVHAHSSRVACHPRPQPRSICGDTGRADGIVVTPSHNPPRDGGFKYNPPHGGPGRKRNATSWIADRANQLMATPNAIDTHAFRQGKGSRHDPRLRLPGNLRRRPRRGSQHGGDQSRRRVDRRGSSRRGSSRLLGPDRRPLGPRSHRRQPNRSIQPGGS